MDNLRILEILKSRGVDTFVHANSVKTSCTFLKHGALLSREYVEKNRLSQTPQSSDALDKEFGIWNDIFLDTVDIHHRARQRNHYGPVLFALNVNSVLRDERLKGNLRITRKNPIHWVKGQNETDRYFDSAEEFGKSFSYGDFGTHFTFRLKDGQISLGDHLKEIVLDDPQTATKDYDSAYSALTAAAKVGKVKAKIVKRECRDGCKCATNYAAEWAHSKSMFQP